MKNIRTCLLFASFLFSLPVVLCAQSNPGKDNITTQYILKQFVNVQGISNREVQLLVVNFPPKSASPAHRHPCPVFGYVLEGELESVFDGVRHIYKKGDCFYEKPLGLHAVARNNDPVKPTKLLVFFINKPSK